MRSKTFLTLCCCLIFTFGCTTKNSELKPSDNNNSGVKLAPANNEHIIELITFCESYSNLTAEAQKKAFAETNSVLAENKNDVVHRIKLAAMLALPSSRLRDNVKAQILLQELLQENNLSAVDSAFTSLLYEYALDNTKQIQKNRDDAKKLDAAQQKADTLEQKLNDLKNIEKTMSERDAKPNEIKNNETKISEPKPSVKP